MLGRAVFQHKLTQNYTTIAQEPFLKPLPSSVTGSAIQLLLDYIQWFPLADFFLRHSSRGNHWTFLPSFPRFCIIHLTDSCWSVGRFQMRFFSHHCHCVGVEPQEPLHVHSQDQHLFLLHILWFPFDRFYITCAKTRHNLSLFSTLVA